ncbi:MAG: sugar phosphate isomerase/epimerase, partial [Firmicutes bacterium]|nr:sugar phosphate isomerase/epimerase [Bacillota bacterium]
ASTDAQILEIKRLADAHGLQLPSLSTGLLWEAPLSAEDARVRARARDIVRRQLEVATLLGAKTVLVVPGLVSESVDERACRERSAEQLTDLAQLAADLGLRIGVENVWNRFLLSALAMAEYVDAIASPAVGVYFDVGNVLISGYPQQWIRILGRRILAVHVKDYCRSRGFVPLLAGDVDWPAVRQALVDIGYDGYVTAEVEPYRHHGHRVARDVAGQLSVILAD